MRRCASRLLRLNLSVACLLIGGTIAACAEDMPTFLKGQANWLSEQDRPQLLVSRGTVISWIPDPFDLPKLFANYMNNGDAPLVVVPPGTAMMAFPPRLKCTKAFGIGCPPAPETDRGMDPNYVLVLTEDGFWGVLDRTQPALILDENDLKPMAKAEQAAEARSTAEQAAEVRFFVAKQQITNVPYAAGQPGRNALQRGQVFREAEPSACTNSKAGQKCLNFDIKSPTFNAGRKDLAKEALADGVKQFDAVQVPEEQVREIRLLDTIVPNTAADAWFGGTGGYEDILTGGAFNSLRRAGESTTAQCGTEWFKESDESVKGELNAEAKAGAGISVIGASAEIKLKVAAAIEAAVKQGEKATIKLAIEPELWPIDLTDKNGKTSSFWGGRAKTCDLGGQTVATIMVSDLPPRLEANATFLHSNSRQIGKG